MQQPQVPVYADIAEVRTVTGAAACNQLLAEGVRGHLKPDREGQVKPGHLR